MMTRLAQAKYPIDTNDVNALLPTGHTFSIPQTVEELVDIGKLHNHALQINYFTESCQKGDFFIFTLCDSVNANNFYTFEFNSKVDNPKFGNLRNAVGFANKPAPDPLCELAKKIAKHLLAKVFDK
jgi:hypothetical protein